MAKIKAVTAPTPDPKIGKPKPKSGVRFPYYDLAKSADVAKAIHEKAGGACDGAQLAPLLGYSGVKNGAFLTRVAAAKMFGFVDQEGEKLRVTKRGQAATAPISDGDAERAAYEAFLSVELFKKVFEKFNGQALPGEAGLTNLLLNEYKVVPDRVPPTLKIMLDSAESAGLFKATGNRTRMVAPILHSGSADPRSKPPLGNASIETQPPNKNINGGNGGDDGGTSKIPAAILGLLSGLPPAGTRMTAKKREALVTAFSATVGYIYPDEQET